jgi:CBS domain-containing protein
MKKLTAKDLMTADVLSVDADWPLHRVAEFFVEKNISGAPVVGASGSLRGVVSLRDLAMHASAPMRDTRPAELHDYFLPGMENSYSPEDLEGLRLEGGGGTTAQDIMTTSLFTVSEDTAVREVADTMVRGRIHRLFVTQDEAVVGIISALDLLRVVRDGLDTETDQQAG